MEYSPEYITIVEGPPPKFLDVPIWWPYSILEGHVPNEIALVQMRSLNGAKLVKRCDDAWQEGREVFLDYPIGDGTREEINIVAAQWERVEEGDKLILWVRLKYSIEK